MATSTLADQLAVSMTQTIRENGFTLSLEEREGNLFLTITDTKRRVLPVEVTRAVFSLGRQITMLLKAEERQATDEALKVLRSCPGWKGD